MRRNPTQVDNFIKSSVADFNDPIFLTFHLDFFPTKSTFYNDGLTNDNLLMLPAGTPEIGIDRTIDYPNPGPHNRTLEYSAYQWITEYYKGYDESKIEGGPHPANALVTFINGLLDLQSSPWYFQSVQGISDLWKAGQRVKEGNKKATLTFSCLESIRQPLTLIAQNYRTAVYDDYRLSYRLPDNLRWFDMEISLIEIRNIVDHGSKSLFRDTENDFYQYENKQLTAGLHAIKFRLRQCEFDFSEFLGGTGQAEFKAFTEEKPFLPTFKVNVGWVDRVDLPVSEANDVHKVGLFSGAFNALSNRLSNVLSAVNRLPGAIAGSVLNDIQTSVEGFVAGDLGNVYEGSLTRARGAITRAGAAITGRPAPVGPTSAEPTANVTDIGDVYP